MSGAFGETATSTGSMVPVYASDDEGTALTVMSLLEEHQIPALVSSELEGTFLASTGAGDTQVLVPTSMLGRARQVLNAYEFHTVFDAAYAPVERPSVFPYAAPSPQEEEEEQTFAEQLGPLERELPDPGPFASRARAALGAIVGGLGFQRLFEQVVGEGEAFRRLGASAASWSEPWRLVTASFIHGGPTHMMSNAIFGLLIGVVLFGTHMFGATALVWLLSSAAGLAAEVLMSPEALVVGASAGNYGLVGLWTRGQFERAKVSALPRRERIRTIGVLLLLIPGAMTPFSSSGTRVAVIAHLVGYFVGVLLGGIFHRKLLEEDFEGIETRSGLAAVLTVGLVGLSFAFALGQS